MKFKVITYVTLLSMISNMMPLGVFIPDAMAETPAAAATATPPIDDPYFLEKSPFVMNSDDQYALQKCNDHCSTYNKALRSFDDGNYAGTTCTSKSNSDDLTTCRETLSSQYGELLTRCPAVDIKRTGRDGDFAISSAYTVASLVCFASALTALPNPICTGADITVAAADIGSTIIIGNYATGVTNNLNDLVKAGYQDSAPVSSHHPIYSSNIRWIFDGSNIPGTGPTASPTAVQSMTPEGKDKTEAEFKSHNATISSDPNPFKDSNLNDKAPLVVGGTALITGGGGIYRGMVRGLAGAWNGLKGVGASVSNGWTKASNYFTGGATETAIGKAGAAAGDKTASQTASQIVKDAIEKDAAKYAMNEADAAAGRLGKMAPADAGAALSKMTSGDAAKVLGKMAPEAATNTLIEMAPNAAKAATAELAPEAAGKIMGAMKDGPIGLTQDLIGSVQSTISKGAAATAAEKATTAANEASQVAKDASQAVKNADEAAFKASEALKAAKNEANSAAQALDFVRTKPNLPYEELKSAKDAVKEASAKVGEAEKLAKETEAASEQAANALKAAKDAEATATLAARDAGKNAAELAKAGSQETTQLVKEGAAKGVTTATEKSLGEMSSKEAGQALTKMAPDVAGKALGEMTAEKAGAALAEMGSEKAGAALAKMGSEKAGAALTEMAAEKAGAALAEMAPKAAGEALGKMAPEAATKAITAIAGEEGGAKIAAGIMKEAGPKAANLITNNLADKTAAAIGEHMAENAGEQAGKKIGSTVLAGALEAGADGAAATTSSAVGPLVAGAAAAVFAGLRWKAYIDSQAGLLGDCKVIAKFKMPPAPGSTASPSPSPSPTNTSGNGPGSGPGVGSGGGPAAGGGGGGSSSAGGPSGGPSGGPGTAPMDTPPGGSNPFNNQANGPSGSAGTSGSPNGATSNGFGTGSPEEALNKYLASNAASGGPLGKLMDALNNKGGGILGDLNKLGIKPADFLKSLANTPPATAVGAALGGDAQVAADNLQGILDSSKVTIGDDQSTMKGGGGGGGGSKGGSGGDSGGGLAGLFGNKSPDAGAGKKAMEFGSRTPTSAADGTDIWHTGTSDSIFDIISKKLEKTKTRIEQMEWSTPLNRAINGLPSVAGGSKRKSGSN